MSVCSRLLVTDHYTLCDGGLTHYLFRPFMPRNGSAATPKRVHRWAAQRCITSLRSTRTARPLVRPLQEQLVCDQPPWSGGRTSLAGSPLKLGQPPGGSFARTCGQAPLLHTCTVPHRGSSTCPPRTASLETDPRGAGVAASSCAMLALGPPPSLRLEIYFPIPTQAPAGGRRDAPAPTWFAAGLFRAF